MTHADVDVYVRLPMRPEVEPLSPLIEVGEVRVLYVDTDQMGVVNNVHYLRWFEIGRAEWIRARGRSYRDVEIEGLMLPVVEAHVRYRSPARYDDLVKISACPSAASPASLTFSYALHRKEDGKLLAEGWTRHACTDKHGKVKRLSAETLELLGIDTKET